LEANVARPRDMVDDPLVHDETLGLDLDGWPVAAGPAQGARGEAAFTLDVADLLPAEDGSVVFDDDGFPIALSGAADVTAAGVAAAEAIAGGQAVGGYSYVVLGSGLTVYYPPESDVSLVGV
jgi:hypothetical protein